MRLAPALPLAAAIILLSAAAPGPANAAGVTSLLLDSEPGEFLGGGEFTFYTPDDGVLEVAPYQPTIPSDVFLRFRGARVPSWNLEFAAPEGELLAVGAYEDAIAPYRIRPPGQPGLQIDGGAGGCIFTFGRFEVKQVAFDAEGVLSAFWATFEQDCEGKVLRGEVRFNADVPVSLVAPSHRTAQEGHELAFPIEGHDALGLPVALSVTGAPAGAALPAGAKLTDAGDGTGRFAWTPAVGQAGRYTVALHGRSVTGDTDAVYTRIDAYPNFDDFDTPIPITGLPFWLRIDDPQASAASDDPVDCGSPTAATVWYSFTPTEDARVQALSYNFVDVQEPTVSIFSGERGALESLACGRYFARADVVAGRNYHILFAYRESAPSQALGLDALPPPPPNDLFEQATVVPALPFTEVIQAGGARGEPGDPGICGGPFHDQSPNIWYSYTPERDIEVTIEHDGYANISVFTGPYDALVRAGCGQANVRFDARAGQTYHVMLSGPIIPLNVEYQVSFTGLPIFDVAVTVAPEGVVDPRSGRAVVRGNVTCSRPARVTLGGFLAQTVRGVTTTGKLETFTIACTGTTPWSAEVAADPGGRRPGRFTRGPVSVFVHGFASLDESPGRTLSIPLQPWYPIALKAVPRR